MRVGLCLCFSAALFMPAMASAANFSIDDTLANETIVVSGSQFDISPFVGAGTFNETITGVTFSGSFVANSTTTGSGIIYWLEPGTNVVSDRLNLSWSSPGGSTENISGTFVSDVGTGNLGTVPTTCTTASNCFVRQETGTVQDLTTVFTNFPSNLTFQVGSDIDPVP